MDRVNKLYHNFFKAFTEVHSTTSEKEVQRRANEKWAQLEAQVKVGDMGPYNEEMAKLKHKKDTIKAKSSITSFLARQSSTKKLDLVILILGLHRRRHHQHKKTLLLALVSSLTFNIIICVLCVECVISHGGGGWGRGGGLAKM